MGRFTGKTAIVTGSSNGIGRGIAVLFAKEGAEVTITGRNKKSLQETYQLCVNAGALKDSIHCVIGNVEEESVLQRLVEETVEKFGKIDILINNAGVIDRENSRTTPGVMGQGVGSYDYIMKINVRCIVQLTTFAVPYLEKTQGEIVNIGSIAAGHVGNSFAFYAMSKAAIDQLTYSLAIELIPKGIRVNCIKPGIITSNLMVKQGMSEKEADAKRKTKTNYHHLALPKIYRNQCASNFATIPIGYYGQPEDIAQLTAFLCDRSISRFIIGQCITIDGGSTLMNPLLCSGN